MSLPTKVVNKAIYHPMLNPDLLMAMTGNGDDPMGQQPQQKKESTRTFAEKHDYDARRLFNKLFNDDILYLLSMANLWKERKKPEPANYVSLIAEGGGCFTRMLMLAWFI